MALNVLLLVYGFLALIDFVFMLLLHFLHDRSGYYKTAAGIWVGVILSFVADGYVENNFGAVTHIFGIPLISITMFSLAKLTQDIYKFELPLKKLLIFNLSAWVLGTVLHFVFQVGFTVSSFIICVGIVLPGFFAGYRLFKTAKKMSIIDHLFGFTLIAESIHILDYPFLRNMEGMAIFGFSFGLVMIYLISILIPVVIVRRLSGDLNETLEIQVHKRTEQLLEVKEKLVSAAKMSALGEMAGGVAHEINTPLAVIGLLGEQVEELLEEDPIDKATISKMNHTIGETVKKISSIVQGLRTFSRDGGMDPFSVVPVGQIIESTLILCQEKVKHGNIEITAASIPDDFKIYCRPVQISQVLLNLVGNACDAILPLQEKWIKIEAEKVTNGIRILITDSGKGISRDIQTKIFQPFFTTKEIGRGAGLGLSISKGIMEIHGGDLFVDVECKNTRFIIECPCTKTGQESPLKAAGL